MVWKAEKGSQKGYCPTSEKGKRGGRLVVPSCEEKKRTGIRGKKTKKDDYKVDQNKKRRDNLKELSKKWNEQ